MCVLPLRPYQSVPWSKQPLSITVQPKTYGHNKNVANLPLIQNFFLGVLPDCWWSEQSCLSAWTVPGPAGFGWSGTAQGSSRCGGGRSNNWTGSALLWPQLWQQHTRLLSCCCRYTALHLLSPAPAFGLSCSSNNSRTCKSQLFMLIMLTGVFF